MVGIKHSLWFSMFLCSCMVYASDDVSKKHGTKSGQQGGSGASAANNTTVTFVVGAQMSASDIKDKLPSDLSPFEREAMAQFVLEHSNGKPVSCEVSTQKQRRNVLK